MSIFTETLKTYLDDGKSLSLFEEEPVKLEVFLYDKAYLGLDITLSDKQFDALAHMTQIYRKKELKAMGLPIYREVNEVVLQWAKGCHVGETKISLLNGT